MPTGSGGQRRLIFTGNVKTNLVNKYTPGSSVGALNTSARRALKRRASSSAGTLDNNGNLIHGKPCCPVELGRKTVQKSYNHLPHQASSPSSTLSSLTLLEMNTDNIVTLLAM